MLQLTPQNESDLISELLKIGVSTACSFGVEDIEFSAEFREMCRQNFCGSYGKNYMCPPAVGDIETLIDEVRTYSRAVLFQTIGSIEDSYDFEGMTEIGDKHKENTQAVFDFIKDNYSFGKLKVLAAGGCRICKKCGILDNVPCRFPDRAISSVEAYCMNVAKLTESHGLKYINGENTVSYVSLVLYK